MIEGQSFSIRSTLDILIPPRFALIRQGCAQLDMRRIMLARARAQSKDATNVPPADPD